MMQCEKRDVVRCLLFTMIVALFLLSGCASQRAWTYKADPYVKDTPVLNKSVAVPPFADQRENSNSNCVGLYLIPLMPFGWQDLNTPEGVQMHINSGLWTFRPNEDFAKAAAEELNNTSMFKEVFFTHRPSDAELTLKGKIISTNYDGKIITYGLSVYGPLLWFIGFPASYVENSLELQLELVDTKTNEVFWQQSFKRNQNVTSIMYAMQPDFMYDSLFKEVMKEAIPSLRNKLSSPPAAASVGPPANLTAAP
ncbi:hypothetical protein SAMN04489760_11556 [Syntrophus gentianae]|uniref:Lipoprotein n=1 Tax=Syntrophus gentianae TaxID=43775 RepID=A0A1H7YC76_9BACT|nr:hypothetical protein [Syntrophus gentianae]SEM43464.1 hypothetical protein SAMN04489760_11556 [Syntrophus gentianae]